MRWGILEIGEEFFEGNSSGLVEERKKNFSIAGGLNHVSLGREVAGRHRLPEEIERIFAGAECVLGALEEGFEISEIGLGEED